MENNPQLENGYTRIANEIVETMCKLKISNYESRFLWCLFRKTYGFGKKQDYIALSQFAKLSGIESQHIARTKTKLVSKNIITVSGGKIGFQKDVSKWVVPNEVVPIQVVPKQVRSSTQTGSQLVPIQVDTKETLTKETIQKKGGVAFADYFSFYLKEDSEKVISKGKKFDLREKDVVFFAEQAMEWARGNQVKDNEWVWWDAFFNRWILRGIKQNKQRMTISKRQEKEEPKKPKYKDIEDYYLKEEGVTIIQTKQTPEEIKKYQEELERKAYALREKTVK